MELTDLTVTARRPATAQRPRPVAGDHPLPAAVAEPVADLVTGGLRAATVLAVHSAAVIVTCDDGEPTRVVTVLAAEASGVPNGLRTALHAADRPFAHLAPGDAAFVGGGGVQLPGLRMRAVRMVRPAVPRVHPDAPAGPRAVAAVAEAATAAPRGVPEAPVRALREALAAGGPVALRSAVHGLVGLGSGSTPGGDDVLCGALAGLHATGRTALADLVAAAALHGVDGRTPLVSADLLRLAARGQACAEAGAVLHAIAAAGGGRRPGARQPANASLDDALHRSIGRLLAVGHTSGADLATGLAIGLGAPRRSLPAQPRRRTGPAVPG